MPEHTCKHSVTGFCQACRIDRWNAAEWNLGAAEHHHRLDAREAHLDWLEGYDRAEDGR